MGEVEYRTLLLTSSTPPHAPAEDVNRTKVKASVKLAHLAWHRELLGHLEPLLLEYDEPARSPSPAKSSSEPPVVGPLAGVMTLTIGRPMYRRGGAADSS